MPDAFDSLPDAHNGDAFDQLPDEVKPRAEYGKLSAAGLGVIGSLPGVHKLSGLSGALGYMAQRALSDSSGVGLGEEGLRMLAEHPELTQEARPEKTFGQLYGESRDASKERHAAASEQHPLAYGAGQVGGTAVMSMAPGLGLSGVAAKGAPMATRLLTAAGAGAKLGGVKALGDTEAFEDPGKPMLSKALQATKDTAVGAGVGGAAGVGGQALGEGIGLVGGKLLRLAGGALVKPTPEALALEAKGVGPLTIKQMAPGSALAQMEEGSSKVPFIGAAIKKQEQAAQRSVMDAVMGEARAPGATGKLAGDINEKMAQLDSEFGAAYDAALKGVQVRPEVHVGEGKWLTMHNASEDASNVKNVFDAVTSKRGFSDATDATRSRVNEFLHEQATRLPKTPTGKVDAKDLQTIRSAIRTRASKVELRSQSLEQDAEADMLRDAERRVTEILEQQLPHEKVDLLRAADAQYSKARVVGEMVGKANDKGEVTLHQLSSSIKKATDSRGYQHGEGHFRDIAKPAQEVFGSEITPTGISWMFPALGTPMVPLYATQGGRNLLLGRTALQRAMRNATGQSLQGQGQLSGALSPRTQAVIEALRSRNAPQMTPTPVYASAGEGE